MWLPVSCFARSTSRQIASRLEFLYFPFANLHRMAASKLSIGQNICSNFLMWVVCHTRLVSSGHNRLEKFFSSFFLSKGEYISPERVENVYSRCPFVAQILVDGEPLQVISSIVCIWTTTAESVPSHKDVVIAIIVPDKDYLLKHCEKSGLSGTFAELCRNKVSQLVRLIHKSKTRRWFILKIKDVIRMVMDDLDKTAKESDLMSYEKVFVGHHVGNTILPTVWTFRSQTKIKSIYLHDEAFSLDNGLVTPTLKPKRSKLRIVFKAEIQKLYDDLRAQKT